jgi:kynureninase
MAHRGSHVSLHCEEGYAVMQALIANGVIGDFRAPDIIRFGFAALYNRYADVFDAVETLHRILARKLWAAPEFTSKKAVT